MDAARIRGKLHKSAIALLGAIGLLVGGGTAIVMLHDHVVVQADHRCIDAALEATFARPALPDNVVVFVRARCPTANFSDVDLYWYSTRAWEGGRLAGTPEHARLPIFLASLLAWVPLLLYLAASKWLRWLFA